MLIKVSGCVMCVLFYKYWYKKMVIIFFNLFIFDMFLSIAIMVILETFFQIVQIS